MPIRHLFERLQEHREARNQERQFIEEGGSVSHAQSNALTNAINVAGIPITNTVSGAHSSSSGGGGAGNINEQFNLGGYGVNAGIDSQGVGSGFGISKTPGQLGVHLGGLNFGLSNNGGLFGGSQSTQTQTSASSTASGQGATSTSNSNTQSHGYQLGNLFNIQNTLSQAQAQSQALNGQTSATAGANAASQTTNSNQYNQGYYGTPHRFGFLNSGRSYLINPFLIAGQPFNQQQNLGNSFYQQFIKPNYSPNYPYYPQKPNYQQYPSYPQPPYHHHHHGYYPSYPQQPFPQNNFPQQSFLQQNFPQQPYPQQNIPQQPFPNQQYPNQQYPNQQYPNQQYPNQQYPGQQYPGQQNPG